MKLTPVKLLLGAALAFMLLAIIGILAGWDGTLVVTFPYDGLACFLAAAFVYAP